MCIMRRTNRQGPKPLAELQQIVNGLDANQVMQIAHGGERVRIRHLRESASRWGQLTAHAAGIGVLVSGGGAG